MQKYNRRIHSYNKWLWELSLVKVIPQPGFTVGDNDIFTKDGIHLNKKGTAMLVRNYKHVLNEIFKMKP